MAVAASHAPPSATAVEPPAAVPRSRRAPRALLVALVACVSYAAFARGAIDLPEESWLQLALVLVAGAALAAWLYGGGLSFNASRAGWAGLAALALFAAWSGATLLWSVAPDRSWLELNRALGYVLVLGLGVALGSSLPRALERTAKGLALAAGAVALYAIGGKTVPGLRIDGLVDLDHAAAITRLRAPLEYWNALALFCVMGLPPALRLAADPTRSRTWRLAGLALVHLLLVAIGMTYSRGGIVGAAVAMAVFVVLTPQRMRTLILFGAAMLAAVVPLALALGSPDLTTNGLPLERREDDAFAVLVALAAATVALLAAGAAVMRLERNRRFTPERGRRIGRALAGAALTLTVFALAGAWASGGLSSAIDRFTDAKGGDNLTDPNRLLSANSGNRWTWWQEAAGAWWDRPLTGWGAGSFPVTHKRYRTVLLSVQQPHSVPLQFLAETGLVGAGLALAGLLALLAAALARARALPVGGRDGGSARGWAAALAALPAAWLVHSLYDWDWDIPGATLPMLVALGVLVGRPRSRPGAGPSPGMRAAALAAGTVVLVLVALSAVFPLLAETRTSGAVEALGTEKVTEQQLLDAAADAEVAAALNPLAVEPLFAAASVAERRGRIDEARRHLLRALDRQPDNAAGWLRLVIVEFKRGDRAALRRAAQRALELDPLNPAAASLARRAHANSALPGESATATGSPLPTQVPLSPVPPAGAVPGTPPAAVPSPSPAPGAAVTGG